MSVLPAAVDAALAAGDRALVVVLARPPSGHHRDDPVRLVLVDVLGRRASLAGGLLHGPSHLDGEVRAVQFAQKARRAVVRARDHRHRLVVRVEHSFGAEIDADAAGFAQLEVDRDFGVLGDRPGLGGRGHESTIGRSMPLSRALSIAAGYPASAWRMTPVPGSVVSTRRSRSSIMSVPSATTTMPAWRLLPMPTPPP